MKSILFAIAFTVGVLLATPSSHAEDLTPSPTPQQVVVAEPSPTPVTKQNFRATLTPAQVLAVRTLLQGAIDAQLLVLPKDVSPDDVTVFSFGTNDKGGGTLVGAYKVGN